MINYFDISSSLQLLLFSVISEHTLHHKQEQRKRNVPETTYQFAARDDNSSKQNRHLSFRNHAVCMFNLMLQCGRKKITNRMSKQIGWLSPIVICLPFNMSCSQDDRCSCRGTSLEVRGPIEIAHSKLKDLSMRRRNLLQQLNGILTRWNAIHMK